MSFTTFLPQVESDTSESKILNTQPGSHPAKSRTSKQHFSYCSISNAQAAVVVYVWRFVHDSVQCSVLGIKKNFFFFLFIFFKVDYFYKGTIPWPCCNKSKTQYFPDLDAKNCLGPDELPDEQWVNTAIFFIQAPALMVKSPIIVDLVRIWPKWRTD